MTLADSQASSLPQALDIWQQTMGWQPTLGQQARFQTLYEEILQGNQQLNLTRITAPEEFWEKHLWDSLRGIKAWLNQSDQLQAIDIGTGAGFPGVPAAIVCPQWQVTLLDSTRKKIAFLTALVATLGVNAHAIVGRAEQVGHLAQYREKYDLALIRAVATASTCAEYTLPLLKLGGVAVLYRGQWLDEETEALQQAAKQLGGTIEQIERFNTPLSHSVRHCIYLKKVEPTRSLFPRSVGIPTQKPL
jgi:16S rRNA (guanine527-N7)-methyltransferase